MRWCRFEESRFLFCAPDALSARTVVNASSALARIDGYLAAILRPGQHTMILKSETYHFHRLDLTRQAGFIVTIYDEDGLRLAHTPPPPTPTQGVAAARKIVDNKVEGPTIRR